jgi:transcription elongation factor Elf1
MSNPARAFAAQNEGNPCRVGALQHQGQVLEQRVYRCGRCGHVNIVARLVHRSTGRVRIAPAWKGKCSGCGVSLVWQDRQRGAQLRFRF